MKISHLQVSEPTWRGRIDGLTARIEHLRGVVGVVAVRSMGLVTVLYDERRTDPVTISDAVVEAAAESRAESVSEAPRRPDAARTAPRRTAVGA